MANFVLVHDAWQGSWSWSGVSAGLGMRGHHVRTVDLPGNGADTTPLSGVTLAAYVQRIVEVVQSVGKPVTLVGHGMGGVACAAAAELAHVDLARLIYLCAFAPCDSDSVEQLQALLPDGGVAPAKLSGDGVTATIPAEFLVASFMHDATAAVAGWAAGQFRPQAIAPTREAVSLTAECHGKVSSSYIVCTEDRIIAPSLQRHMAQRAGCRRIKELALSHSPFLSAPFTVAETLHRLVTEH